jgi:inorganic pyrophosphatase
MSARLTDLPHNLDKRAFTCRAIVETPHGSRAKFIYDEQTGLFGVGKLLPAGLAFPVDFGFVPSTLGGDEDPLDLLILAEVELPVGCLVTARLLGAMEVEQWRGGEPRVRNDRLIARLAESRTFAAVERMEQLGRGFTDELSTFFRTYKEARGQRCEVLALGGPERAVELIEQAANRR